MEDMPQSTLQDVIINASAALSDIAKPPEMPAVQPNVPEIAPMVFELTSREKRRASPLLSLSY